MPTANPFTDSRGNARAPRNAAEARMAEAQAEAVNAATLGCCPRCGAGVKLNLAITGWIQCEQYGAVGFRRDSAAAQCGWQGFLPATRRA